VARQKPVHERIFLKPHFSERARRTSCGRRKQNGCFEDQRVGMPSVLDLPDQPLRCVVRFLGAHAASLLGCCAALRARSERDALLWRPCLEAALATKEGRARLRPHSHALIARFPAFHKALPLELAEQVHAFAVSLDGLRVAYESGASINVVNAATFDRVARCEYSRPMIYGLGLGLCFSFDGALLALRVVGKCAFFVCILAGELTERHALQNRHLRRGHVHALKVVDARERRISQPVLFARRRGGIGRPRRPALVVAGAHGRVTRCH